VGKIVRSKDEQRDKELTEVGWITFRINKDSLKILSQQKIFTILGGS
jgi:very-short-patch-repair endonuclease